MGEIWKRTPCFLSQEKTIFPGKQATLWVTAADKASKITATAWPLHLFRADLYKRSFYRMVSEAESPDWVTIKEKNESGRQENGDSNAWQIFQDFSVKWREIGQSSEENMRVKGSFFLGHELQKHVYNDWVRKIWWCRREEMITDRSKVLEKVKWEGIQSITGGLLGWRQPFHS